MLVRKKKVLELQKLYFKRVIAGMCEGMFFYHILLLSIMQFTRNRKESLYLSIAA